jgi:hypothetical protein
MPKVPWHLFQDRQPRAHLVVGAIAQPNAPMDGDELTEAQVVLRRLVNEQKPAGDYAGDFGERCRPSRDVFCFQG